MAYTNSDLGGALRRLSSGKVRDLYEIDADTLLFVATDRISAYDVVMENVRLVFICFVLGSPRSFLEPPSHPPFPPLSPPHLIPPVFWIVRKWPTVSSVSRASRPRASC